MVAQHVLVINNLLVLFNKEKQRFLLFILLCFIGPLVKAQTDEMPSKYHQITRSDLPDSTKIKKVDSLLFSYKKRGEKDSVEYSASRYSNWLTRENKPADYLKSAEIYELVLENNSRSDVILQRRYILSSKKYLKVNMYAKSFAALEKAIEIQEDGEWAAEAYMKIADNYYNLGDYKLSSEYYQIAERLFVSLGLKEDELRCFINSYSTLSRLGTPSSREKLLKNTIIGDSIIENIPVNQLNAFYMMRVSGLYYSDNATRDIKKGTAYLLKALEISKHLDSPQNVAETYQNLGVLYARENPEKAIAYSELGLSFTQEENQKERAALYANIGLSNAYKNAFEDAIKYLNYSINAIVNTDFTKLTQAERLEVLRSNASDENLWVILGNLGQTYLKRYEVEKVESDLQNALKYFGYVDYIFDQLQQQNANTSSKFLWRRKALEIYSLAIKASYLKGDAESVFQYMEKSKALVLIEEIKARNALMTSEIPENLVLRMARLKSEIAALEGLETQEAVYTDKLLATKRNLLRLTDSLKGKYNTYELNMYNSAELSTLKETRNRLSMNECIIEYHLSSDSGYGLVTSTNVGYGLLIDKSQTLIFEIPDIRSLKEAVLKLQGQLSKPFKNEEDIEKYQALSHSIYTRLFPTEKVRLAVKEKELKVVLDDFLTRIPMEALSVSEKSKDLKYFVEETDCHYSYSVTFDNNLEEPKNKALSFLAVAPMEFDDKSLGSLDYSLNEVEALKNIFAGTSFIKEHATKSNFLRNQKEAQIFHLATHANATDSITPWISFRDEKLSLDELYLLNNKAAMVVLSACNTSTGELASGEGVLSLARGFFYGGAQSVVSSLWKVDDIATSELMSSFYTHLDAGANKGTALNSAKLDYLSTHSGSEASPYYWSSFVLNGNIEAVRFKKNTPYWAYVLGGLFIILFFYFFLRMRRA